MSASPAFRNKPLKNNNTILAVDLGSEDTKAATNASERVAKFPSLIGRTKNAAFAHLHKPYYVGEDAYAKRPILKITSPIGAGFVNDAADACLLIENAANDVQYNMQSNYDDGNDYLNNLNNNNNTLVLADRSLKLDYSATSRTELMKQCFDSLPFVQQLSIVPTTVLALIGDYCSQQQQTRTAVKNPLTGIVVESGEGVTLVSIVKNGLIQAQAQHACAGKEITEYCMKLLSESGQSFSTAAERLIAKDIKEKLCYVALDYDKEVEKFAAKDHIKLYELGCSYIFVGDAQFKSIELLFQTEKFYFGSLNLPTIIHNCVKQATAVNTSNGDDSSNNTTKQQLVQELLENILLVGGTMAMKGMAQRLRVELTKLFPSATTMSIRTNSGSYLNVDAALLMANEPSFQQFLVTRQEYLSEGADKCVSKLMYAHTVDASESSNYKSYDMFMETCQRSCRAALALEAMVSSAIALLGSQMQAAVKFTNVVIEFQ